MHRQTGARAAAAMSEMLELLGTIAKGPIDCTISYNELVLTMRFAYDGRPLVLPHKAPDADELTDAPDGVMRWAAGSCASCRTIRGSRPPAASSRCSMAFEC